MLPSGILAAAFGLSEVLISGTYGITSFKYPDWNLSSWESMTGNTTCTEAAPGNVNITGHADIITFVYNTANKFITGMNCRYKFGLLYLELAVVIYWKSFVDSNCI